MHTVSDILIRKGASAVAVKPDTNVLDALLIMADKNIGSVLVMDGGEYSGIVTERDCARKIALKNKNPSEIKVSEIMCTDLPSVMPSHSIEHCMNLMTEKNIRYLPVFEKELICGIVSMSDLIKEIILEKKETKDNPEKYIYSES